jgi:hypothetical protein
MGNRKTWKPSFQSRKTTWGDLKFRQIIYIYNYLYIIINIYNYLYIYMLGPWGHLIHGISPLETLKSVLWFQGTQLPPRPFSACDCLQPSNSRWRLFFTQKPWILWIPMTGQKQSIESMCILVLYYKLGIYIYMYVYYIILLYFILYYIYIHILYYIIYIHILYYIILYIYIYLYYIILYYVILYYIILYII